MSYNPHIESAIENGYEFKIGDYFNKGLEMFKKNPGGYLGFAVIFMLIYFVINLIPFIGSLINIAVSPALAVGFAIAVHKQEKLGSDDFGNFFKGFDYLAQLLVANIIITLIYVVLVIPLIFMVGFSVITALASGDAETIMESSEQIASMGLGFLVVFLLFVYVSLSLRWTFFLIVFHKYDAVEAIKTSWKLVNKSWLMHFVFMLLFFIAMFAGVLALIIGVIFVFPILMIADYAGYADITGLDRKDDIIDEIGSFKDEIV
jgi:uncharacterized membrane protein